MTKPKVPPAVRALTKKLAATQAPVSKAAAKKPAPKVPPKKVDKPKTAPALNAKNRLFAQEYLVDLNGTQAAIRAGYSKKTAGQQGFELLKKPEIQAEIQRAMEERANRVGVSADRVLGELARLAFADIRKVFTADGQLLPVHELPESVAASISSIEVVTSRVPGGSPADVEHTSKIKFWDKRGSLELLGKHLKLFTDKVELGGVGGGPLQLQAIPDKRLEAVLSEALGAIRSRA